MPSKRILVVEDEPSIADTLVHALSIESFEPTRVATISKAREALKNNTFAAIILDVGLPDGNGFDFCKEIRLNDDIPILFLTARDDELDQVRGLEIGADDYVTKPFSPIAVVLRVKTILRRTQDPTPAMASKEFHVDEERQRVTFKEKALELSNIEYKILKLLINAPGRVYTRDEIMDSCWSDSTMSLDRTVDAHIKTIRKKLKAIDPDEQILKTRVGVGYYLYEKD